ncbi:MAG: helix-turn-helix transcriptional regulator, partial [Acidobacteriaceae bacterium]
MDAHPGIETAVSAIAAAIAEPARTRMLYSLLDGHARTGTELAMVAEVAPSTASVHLNRLKAEKLVKVLVQGRHRYYSLAGPEVARTLERLSVLAGVRRTPFVPATPEGLRTARSCYDHMAGAVAVSLHDEFLKRRWIEPAGSGSAYTVSPAGAKSLAALGLDLDQA